MSTSVTGTPASRNSSNRSGKGKRALVLALTALGVCLLLFSSGFFVGRRGLAEARAALAKNKAESAKQITGAKVETEQAKAGTRQIQARLMSTQAQMQVAAARNWLYRSVVAVDQRNFGTAQIDLKQAADILKGGSMEGAGFTAVQSQALNASLQAVNLTVSPDPEIPRKQILQAAEQMDAMLDAMTLASALVPAP